MQVNFAVNVPPPANARPFPQHLVPHLAQMGIPVDQAMGYWNTFNHFDMDGSGAINVAEMVTGLQLMGQCPTPSDVQNMMMQADQNHDGQVDFLEYVRVTHTRVQPPQAVQNDLVAAFRVFDRDGSGFLDASELRAVLCQRGMKESDFDRVMAQVDLDRDGRLNYNEFVGMMTRPLDVMMHGGGGGGGGGGHGGHPGGHGHDKHHDGHHDKHHDKHKGGHDKHHSGHDKHHKKHKKHGSRGSSRSSSDSD